MVWQKQTKTVSLAFRGTKLIKVRDINWGPCAGLQEVYEILKILCKNFKKYYAVPIPLNNVPSRILFRKV